MAERFKTKENLQPQKYRSRTVSNSIHIQPASVSEILRQIKSLNDNKAEGHDNIPAYFLKIAKNEIAPYHRRPISSLTCFSKIIEILIYKTFVKFFEKNKVIDPNQYRFRCNLSTVYAKLDVVNTAYNYNDRNLYTGLILIDIKKAFDTVCGKALLTKLEYYGIHGVAYSLINSYLLNRKQFVSLNQFCSNLTKISYGVSQGSSLGPLFFLICINDVLSALDCTPKLFADDTCLLVQASNFFYITI